MAEKSLFSVSANGTLSARDLEWRESRFNAYGILVRCPFLGLGIAPVKILTNVYRFDFCKRCRVLTPIEN